LTLVLVLILVACGSVHGEINSVAIHAESTVAVDSKGRLWAWGTNSNGQLGLGDTAERNIPTRVGTDNDWSSVDCFYHTLAIKSDGSLWAWGSNGNGQLGLGDTTERHTPTKVGTDNDWAAIACGSGHSLALKKNGTLWAWGSNYHGELGLGDTTSRYTPTQVGTDNDWVLIAAGVACSLALKSNGTLWAWGYNCYGQLGLGDNTDRYTPTKVGTDNDWVYVTCSSHSLAIKSNGTLWAWGRNDCGQLGLGDTTNRWTPTQVGTDNDWRRVSAGGLHTLALKRDNTLWAWGYGANGRLGLGDENNRYIPTQVGADNRWVSVRASNDSSFAVTSDGTLWAWGWGSELGCGNGLVKFRPVAVFRAGFEPHDSILIEGDAGFTPENGVRSGLGTKENPYIIENWQIPRRSTAGVLIRNTTSYFVVRNCYIEGCTNGIVLENATNGMVQKNMVVGASEWPEAGKEVEVTPENALWLGQCENLSLSGNVIENIVLSGCKNILVQNCIVENGANHGVLLDTSENISVENCIIRRLALDGVQVSKSKNCRVENCQVEDCSSRGISLLSFSKLITLSGSRVSGCPCGIFLSSVSQITLLGNTVENSTTGLQISDSTSVTLRNNLLRKNKKNLDLSGTQTEHFTHDIDNTNTVDGKPVIYLVGAKNLLVSEAGYLALIGTKNIAAKNLVLENNGQGILIRGAENTLLENLLLRGNSYAGLDAKDSENILCLSLKVVGGNYGVKAENSCLFLYNVEVENGNSACIWLRSCKGSVISGSLRGNSQDGVYLEQSPNCTIEVRVEKLSSNATGIHIFDSSGITIQSDISNCGRGISLTNVSGSTVHNCKMSNLQVGIYAEWSENNLFVGDNIVEFSQYGVYLRSSRGNTLSGNTTTSTKSWSCGIYLEGSDNNTLAGNTTRAYGGIVLTDSSDNNLVRNNTDEGSYIGIGIGNSENDVVWGNSCVSNQYGIYLSSATACKILGNTLTNCSTYGLYATSSSGNTIYLNLLRGNGTHAYDDGSNAWDNGELGNFWENWQPPDLPDANSDGVVDEPYPIAGGTRRDNFPLAIPRRPKPLSPENGATVQKGSVTLQWEAAPYTPKYRLVVSRYPDFSENAFDKIVTTTSITLTLGSTYYWKVAGVNAWYENWSGVYCLTTLEDTTPPTGSISINQGARFTRSTSATLYLTYQDDTGVSAVRYSNDGVTWTDWEAPAPTKPWILTAGDGEKTVYYQIRDAAGNLSQVYTASIVLDTRAPKPVLSVGIPTAGGWYCETNSPTFYLTGTIEPKCMLYLDGVLISTGGSFSKTLSLSPGINRFTLLAEDEAGNMSTGTLEVYYKPSVSAPSGTSPAPLLFFTLAAVLLIACSALFVYRLRH